MAGLDFLLNLRADTSGFNQGIDGARSAVALLTSVLAAVGLGLTAKELLETADATQQMASRLKIATDSVKEYNEVQDRLLVLANATYRPLAEAQEVYLATAGTMKSLGYSTEEVLAVTESLSLSFTHNATRADQAQSAQDALAQSMAKGKVDADAWMSIITGADNVVGDLARSTGRTQEEVRKLGAEGKMSIKELTNALIESRDRNLELATSMATSSADAIIAVKNNFTALIGTMNEQYNISGRVAEVIQKIGGETGWLEAIFHDTMRAIDELSDSFGGLDGDTFEAFKGSVASAYETVKQFVLVGYELATDVMGLLADGANSALSLFTAFAGGTTEAGESVGFLTRVMQGLSILLGAMSDGIYTIRIAVGFLTGAFYDVAAAVSRWISVVTWGDVSKQFAANADVMQAKAEQHYGNANKLAADFQSQTIKRLDEAAKTEQQRNAEAAADAKAKFEQIAADAEASETAKSNAAKAWVEAAIKANGDVLSEQTKNDLAAQGYAISVDEAGKVAVKAMQSAAEAQAKAAENAEKLKLATEAVKKADEEYLAYRVKANSEREALEKRIEEAKKTGDLNTLKSAQDALNAINLKDAELFNARKARIDELNALQKGSAGESEKAYTKASEAAQKLGINIDQALNRVSEKFKESSKALDAYIGQFPELGVKGEKAAEQTLFAWQKWLETAKSQAEVDFAKQKLQEFGNKGQLSTEQVKLGMEAIKAVVRELPAELSEVEKSFERLGIRTKEQLKLQAELALSDFENVRQSGQATQADLQKAYEKTIQLAHASGDAQSIAIANAKAASLGLQVQVSETGDVSVKSMNEVADAVGRVAHRASNDGAQGFRNMASAARELAEEAKHSIDQWNDALTAQQKAEAEASKNNGPKGGAVNSMSKADIESELQSRGYSAKDAKKYAQSLFMQGLDADKAVMSKNLMSANGQYANKAFQDLHNQGLTSNYGTAKINELLAQFAVGNASTTSTNPEKLVKYELNLGGNRVELTGTAGQEDLMNAFLSDLEEIKSRT